MTGRATLASIASGAILLPRKLAGLEEGVVNKKLWSEVDRYITDALVPPTLARRRAGGE